MSPFARGLLVRIKNAPGVSCIELSASTGESCPVITAGLRELKRSGKVRTKGNTKGVKYYARA